MEDISKITLRNSLIYEATATFLHEVYPGGWQEWINDHVPEEHKGSMRLLYMVYGPMEEMA